MPHGGGHHGGGFHHGGGGGGGWGHHHHHHGGWGRRHHHHHHHYPGRWVGGGWGWGWGPYGYAGYYRYQRARFYRGWSFCIGMLMVITLIVVLSISLSVRYRDYDSANNDYAPGDTRIISYSSFFCEKLTLNGDEPAKLFLLRNTPPLSGPIHNISANFVAYNPRNNYQYLYYYLYPGTKVSMTYCVDSVGDPGKSLVFAFIKGNSNFREWEDDGSSSHTVRQFSVSNLCSSGPSLNFNYTINSEDTYYFVYDNVAYTTDFQLNAILRLNRTEYVPSAVTIKDSCSIENGVTCSISIPLGSDYVALLQVSDEAADIGEDTNINYSWYCGARVWVYVLIVVLPLAFVLVMTLIILTVCLIYVRRKSKRYSTVPTTAASNEVAEGTETPATSFLPPEDQTVPTAPPPKNPGYYIPPPLVHGATDTPPPYPTT